MTPGAASSRDYTRRRRLRRIVWLAAIPAAVLAIVIGPRALSWAIGMVWLVALIGADVYFEAWPCPRCGKSFFRKGAWHNSFASRCVHCDFPKPVLGERSRLGA